MIMISLLRRSLRPFKRGLHDAGERLKRTATTGILPHLNLAVTAVVNGERFRIPIHRGVGWDLRHSSETWMTDLLRRLLEAGASPGLLDVGVNIGQTLLKLKSIDPAIRYCGFEPNPFCVSFVHELIRLNGFTDCRLAPVALSDRPGLFEFIAGSDSDSGGSMVADLRPEKTVVRKQIIAALHFDALDLDLNRIGLVKIDVEGAELHVLRGMKEFLRVGRPCVVCEVLHAHSLAQVPRLHQRNAEIIELMDDLAYTIFRIVKGDGRIAGLERIVAFPDAVWADSSEALCDFLMLPDERVSAIVGQFNMSDA
jgi:FkbM family methyltransferase